MQLRVDVYRTDVLRSFLVVVNFGKHTVVNQPAKFGLKFSSECLWQHGALVIGYLDFGRSSDYFSLETFRKFPNLAIFFHSFNNLNTKYAKFGSFGLKWPNFFGHSLQMWVNDRKKKSRTRVSFV